MILKFENLIYNIGAKYTYVNSDNINYFIITSKRIRLHLKNDPNYRSLNFIKSLFNIKQLNRLEEELLEDKYTC